MSCTASKKSLSLLMHVMVMDCWVPGGVQEEALLVTAVGQRNNLGVWVVKSMELGFCMAVVCTMIIKIMKDCLD
jgi:hypothetical protein